MDISKSRGHMLLPGVLQWSKDDSAPKMEINSSGVHHKIIADRFGSRGCKTKNGMPTRSLPILISSAPPETKTFALTVVDTMR